MTDETHYFTDTVSATLEYAGDGDGEALFTDEEEADFDPSEAETVTRDGPWTDFFGTDEFVQFEATVAQPIVQPYVYDGELKQFRKDEDELKRAQAQIDNLPWTMGHPPRDRVTNASQIKGVWSDPRWNDGQQASLNIPANDPEAVRHAVHNDEVSVGFGGVLDWADSTDADWDATQRDMAYDHIASVENGRCPPEKGCGLHTDSSSQNSVHGHVTDAVRTQQTEEGAVTSSSEWNVGDFVAIMQDGDRVHGRVVAIQDGSVMVQPYDGTDDRFDPDAITVDTSDLQEWVGPQADSCPGDGCSCGCHLTDDFTDAPDGIHVEDGTWYGIAPSETADDEPKYELNNCNDVKDAFNLRNNGDYEIETSTLVARIKRASESHDCPPEQKPWGDSHEAAVLAQAIKQSAD